MINWIAASSALIIIIASLRRILSGRIALRLQYALWLVVLVRLFFPLELGSLPFALSNAVEQIPIVQEFEDIQNVQVLEHTESGAVVGYTGTSDETAPLQIYDKKTDAEFAHIENTLKFRDIALPLWKAGIAVLIAVFFASNLCLSRRLKKERTLLSDTGDLPVYITSQVETPCLFGFFSPAIYVTPEVAADETVLRHTLEHELTHYRHWDQLWAVLRCCALALHWYNPLVWWVAKLSRSDAELACDEATLIRLGEEERAEYGRTLIRMTCQGPSRLLTTATTMTGSKGTLKERISLIAKKPKMALYTLIAVIIIAVCAAVFTFTGSDVSTNRKLCDWMQSVTAEELSYAYISEGYGSAVTSYTLDSEFRAELVRILNSLEWNQFGMDQHAGAPDRRLFATTGAYLDWDEEFIFGIREDNRISISFLTEFGEEISKPGKGWYVTSPELSSFINDILDGKTSLQESSEYLRADLDADGEDEIRFDDYAYSVYGEFIRPYIIHFSEELQELYPSLVINHTIEEFYPVWSYAEEDGSTVTLYHLDGAFFVDKPEEIQLTGGMYFDENQRLRGFFNPGAFAVRHRNNILTATCFMGNDFGYMPPDSDGENWAKETIKKELDSKENLHAYYTPEEIESAITVVEQYFERHFAGCKIESIDYAGNLITDNRRKFHEATPDDELIVLLSSIYVGPDGANELHSPGSTYNLKWFLVRNSSSDWILKDTGTY
ncbi:MAG: M56 family metallopeptidase [Firmicutes bacterium]|nr:M56 family metallopeptidase [Bacillota bacterium]